MADRRSATWDAVSAFDVVVPALRESAGNLDRHVARLSSGVEADPDAVHQARVATRAIRSNLTVYRGVVHQDWADALRSDLSWLGAVLGSVRDADVLHDTLSVLVEGLVEESDPADGAIAVALLDRSRVQAERRRDALRRAGAEGDLSEVSIRVVEALDEPVPGDLAHRLVTDVVVASARRAWKKLDRDAGRILRDGPDLVTVERLHRLRVRAKKLRYAAEAAAPWEKGAKRHARAVRRVQDELGLLHDVTMAVEWLRAEVTHLDTAACFVAGRVCGRADEEVRRRRRTWIDPWRRAADDERRGWLNEGRAGSSTA